MSLTIPPSPSSSSQPTMLSYYCLAIPLTLSFLLISLTRAQQNFPPCVIPCAKSAAQSSGCDLYVPCSRTYALPLSQADTPMFPSNNKACLCTNPAFAKAVTACVQSSCSASDAQAAADLAKKICST
ncbi:hypothetical protein BJV78DRAFT_784520 [Lactifluus subvellereus]|nr:hypothetical protein BJV78DRAFT_784520 [Lactifluus subvellereus]